MSQPESSSSVFRCHRVTIDLRSSQGGQPKQCAAEQVVGGKRGGVALVAAQALVGRGFDLPRVDEVEGFDMDLVERAGGGAAVVSGLLDAGHEVGALAVFAEPGNELPDALAAVVETGRDGLLWE